MKSPAAHKPAPWPRSSACPVCQARYQLSRSNLGHRTVCQKCGSAFHLLPASEDSPTVVLISAQDSLDIVPLVGRLWLDLRPGQIVSERYRVVCELGQGGLSRIYKVADLERDKFPLALKLPLPSTLDRVAPKILIDEAAAWLKPAIHPNLVTCDHVEMIMNRPAIFMEYIDGADLSELTDEGDGPLYDGSAEEAAARLLDIFIQTARGLKYAHSLGLAHLDIKPRNVLVEKGGRALIGDYGPLIDRSSGGAGDEDNPEMSKAATRISGTRLMGTHQYLSPEAAEGQSGAGPGDDLWALSLTALECFMGRRSWEMGSVAGRALNHYLADSPKIPISRPLADFFHKALNLDPRARHLSAGELEKDLSALYSGLTGRPYFRPSPAFTPDSPERRRLKALALKSMGRGDYLESA